MKIHVYIFIIFTCLFAVQCEAQSSSDASQYTSKTLKEGLSTAYFASGCFWCVEAIYESVKGVEEAVSGYSGGDSENPTYRKVGTNSTGHAEAVVVYYDASIISFETLVKIYYASQDPTTVNGQHPDYGSSYRSIIFYETEEERQFAESYKKKIASNYTKPIATEIVPFEKFWPAEDYHQDYEKRNPNQPYVRAVSIPRLKRFQAKHPELLKETVH